MALIGTYESTYELVHSRKPTSVELVKSLHQAYLLIPNAMQGGGSNDDDDDSKPMDVVLVQPEESTKASNK